MFGRIFGGRRQTDGRIDALEARLGLMQTRLDDLAALLDGLPQGPEIIELQEGTMRAAEKVNALMARLARQEKRNVEAEAQVEAFAPQGPRLHSDAKAHKAGLYRAAENLKRSKRL